MRTFGQGVSGNYSGSSLTTPSTRRQSLAPKEQPVEISVASYKCARDHETAVPFAAGVIAPNRWNCRHCHQPAALSDRLPLEALEKGREGLSGASEAAIAELRKRRSTEALEALLEAALVSLKEH